MTTRRISPLVRGTRFSLFVAFAAASSTAAAQRAPTPTATPAPAPLPTASTTATTTAPSALTRAIPDAPPAPKVGFREAVREAMARNPNAAVAKNDVRRAEALLGEARAGSLPTLTGNGIYTRLDADRELSGRVIQGANQVQGNVLLTVPIVMPQKWAAWSHAGDAIDVARATEEDTRRQVAVASARAYLAIITQHRVVEVNQHALNTAREHYAYSHQRYTGGVGNRLDEVRAAQEVATDASTLESSVAALAKAEEALGVLLGREGPVDAAEDTGLGAPQPLASALSSATTRPDVRAADIRVESASHTKRDSWTDYLPYLVGNAQVFYQDPPSLITPQTGWQAQLLLTLPLYDGGLRYGLAGEREANVEAARIAREGLLRQARSEVRTAAAAVERADGALGSAREAAEIAKESLGLANVAYRAGATTNLEVIDAERRLRDAESQAAIAEDAARQARFDLLAASGHFP